MILPHPALWLLQKRKLAGVFRKQVRRAKTLKGAMLALTGILVLGLWLASFLFGTLARNVSGRTQPGAFQYSTDLVQVAIAALTMINILASLGFRGLFIPKEEIELLFSAPVSRADVVRYRLLVNFGRTLFGSLIFAAVATRSAPVPLYAFLGAFLAMQTIPVLGQSFSILAGDAENRFFAKAPRRLFKIAGIAGFFVFVMIAVALFATEKDSFRKFVQQLVNDGGTGVLQLPVVKALTSFARPWALAITAQSAGQFLLWFGVSLAIWVAMFELAARLPVDFRELSLETSADWAKRLNRVRRGGGAASHAPVSKSTIGWNVPWVAGRGRFGALAWRKLASMVRKSRTALTVSIIILLVAGVGLPMLMQHGNRNNPEPFITIMITVVGMMYLCNGLRFDFREDLDKMEFLKTCPVSGWKIFVATLLPETLLVSLLIFLVHAIRYTVEGRLDPILFFIIPTTPLLTFIWIAVDNIAYLFAPVRPVAGQDTMLQNAGKAFIMMIVRMLAIALFIALAAIPYISWKIVCSIANIHISESWPAIDFAIALTGIPIAFGEAAILAWVGGVMIRRFDVAFDRG
jgi:hypothetical protein